MHTLELLDLQTTGLPLSGMALLNPLAGAAAAGVYVDPLLKRQKIEDLGPTEFLSIPITDLNQSGPLVAGEIVVINK